MVAPKVAVIVLNWNGKHFMKECLDSLLKQGYKNHVIYFVDNFSSDDSVDFVRKFYKSKSIKIMALDKNYGFAEGNNIGIREAMKDKTIKYFIILNNDTRVDPKFIEEFVKGAQRHKEAGSFASKIVMYSNPGIVDSAGMMFYKNCMPAGRGAGEPAEKYSEEIAVFGAPGAAAMYTREMLIDIAPDRNYYDPEFFIYQEEFDLSWRAKLHGWFCFYIPKAIVHHIGSGVMRKFSKRAKYLLERNRIWAMSKNMNKSVLLYSLPHVIIYEIVSLPFYTLGGYLPAVIRGRIDGIRGIRKFSRKKGLIQISSAEQISWMVNRNYAETFKSTFLGGG